MRIRSLTRALRRLIKIVMEREGRGRGRAGRNIIADPCALQFALRFIIILILQCIVPCLLGQSREPRKTNGVRIELAFILSRFHVVSCCEGALNTLTEGCHAACKIIRNSIYISILISMGETETDRLLIKGR